MADLDEIDPSFVEDLKASEEHVWKVARWLHSIGRSVAVQPTRVRPSSDERFDYGDQGDLVVLQRVEVKQRKLDFTCYDDFPRFGEPAPWAIVDVCHAWDRAWPKPAFYVNTNRQATHAFIIDTHATEHHWEARDIEAWGRTRRYYFCPLEVVSWVRLG